MRRCVGLIMQPWRKVTHIENRYKDLKHEVGSSLTWFLTLECGHFKSVHGGTLRSMRGSIPKLRTAPKKVRCLICYPE